jgi:hypothetical protein
MFQEYSLCILYSIFDLTQDYLNASVPQILDPLVDKNNVGKSTYRISEIQVRI